MKDDMKDDDSRDGMADDDKKSDRSYFQKQAYTLLFANK
jgi:hypothetical protein